jgi:hypothetical protein
LQEPNLGKTNPCVTLFIRLRFVFAPSLSDSLLFLTLTRLVVVINFVNFSFALFTPPSRRLSTTRPPRPTNPTGGHTPAATERTTKKDIIKVGTADVVIQEDKKGSMIFGELANTTKIEDTATIKTADPKYSMPRWCPAGLTRSQKRKLQRLRAKESQEKEAEKIFNDTHPQYPPPQKKWRPKAVEEKQTLVQHPTGTADSLASKAGQSAPGADRPLSESGSFAPHQEASNDIPTSMEEDDLLGEDLVDYEASPERPGMDVNAITFSVDCTIVGDDEPVVAQFDFGPKETAFTKPKESVNHLKPLFVCGHIDGIPIAKMLVDGGAAVNLMPYSLYRKLCKQDDELVKTNMPLSGVGTNSLIKARGVTSVELTIGTKTIAAAFFVADVEGNYSLILGRDWIHVNQCIPSTLHQMLIQWVGNDVEQVHADVSACIALADVPVLWTYETATCLTGVDFSDYQFISIDKKGFILVMLEPMENWLNPK